MIKKTLLTFVLAAIVGMISAQSLQFELDGVVFEDGQTVIAPFDEDMYEYIQHLQVRNLTDGDLDVIIEQNVSQPAQGALVSVCWGDCASPADTIITRAVTVAAQTLSPEDLSCHVMFGEGETGVVEAVYYAYPATDTDNRISIIVLSGQGAGVAENNINMGQAYPNPATSQVSFDFKANNNTNINAVVYNLLGQEVKSQSVNGNRGRVSIAVDDLQPGIYFCSFQVNSQVIKTEKFIVKR